MMVRSLSRAAPHRRGPASPRAKSERSSGLVRATELRIVPLLPERNPPTRQLWGHAEAGLRDAQEGTSCKPFLHHNPRVAGAVLRIFLRAIRTTLRDASPGAGPDAQIGAISFLHRFGASLNAHFHVCVIDGVFGEDPEGSVQFQRDGPPLSLASMMS